MSKHGAVGWFEIGTPDIESAREFYGTLFGWTFERDAASGQPYDVVTTGEEHPIQGGICHTRGEIPPYAVPCVIVDDADAAAAETERLGGKVLVPPQTIETGLRFAHLLDPQGNHIGIFTPPPGA